MKTVTLMRERRGWSKSELARRAGLNQTTVSAVENGRLIPYDSQLQKLARALDAPDPDTLLDEVSPDG